MARFHGWTACLLVLALLLSSSYVGADDKEDGKKQTVRAIVVAAHDGDANTIRIEGGSLEGGAFIERTSWNDQYYDAFAPSRAIVIDRKFYNGHADSLRSLLP